MKLIVRKLVLIHLIALLVVITASACDGIFPTQTKSNLPSDHNSSYGGYLHKSIRRQESGSDCEECHGSDLRGMVFNYNGTLVVTQSCYQCHGKIWDEGGGGGNKTKY